MRDYNRQRAAMNADRMFRGTTEETDQNSGVERIKTEQSSDDEEIKTEYDSNVIALEELPEESRGAEAFSRGPDRRRRRFRFPRNPASKISGNR